MRYRFLACLAGAALLASAGCVYVPPVTQGNLLVHDDLTQLKVGMTRKQVLFLFGEPMLANPFYPHTWHYVYYYKPGARSKKHIYRLTVNFRNGKVANFATSKPISESPGAAAENGKATPQPVLEKESRKPPPKPQHPTPPTGTGNAGGAG
ncbi:MAG: outer membrane protein assembly factor BamE [Gammaproteobacteria bacterium]